MKTQFSTRKETVLRIFTPASLWLCAVAGVIFSAALLPHAGAQQASPSPAAAASDVQLPANAGRNLALNKKYVCSAPNTHPGWAGGLVDGDWREVTGHTFATDGSPNFPKTVTIDLETPADIGLVLVGVPAFGSTKTIAVSLSTDGTNFTEVGSYVFSQKKSEKHLYSFPAASARYVRLTYLDHYDSQVGYAATFAFTTEVEVYAPGK